MLRSAKLAFIAACILAVSVNHCFAVSFTGVNLAGAEFGSRLPGTYNTDYTYPTTAEINYFVGKGMNTFRVPFRWERVQPTLNSAFNSTFNDGFNGADGAGQADNPYTQADSWGDDQRL